MFTGIIEEVGRVISVRSGSLVIVADGALRDTKPGDSMAVNGVCLTITSLTADTFAADIMLETARRSNLGLLAAGDRVNLERALALGGRLGGHLVQGHVDATGELASIRRDGEALLIGFKATNEVMSYVVEKGFIAVDGISLTVVARDAASFQVSVVDFTYRHTNLGGRRVGAMVNLEVDIIAKYVEQLAQTRSNGITVDYLREHGFLVN
ncbi:MAG: riboflavin synthase [Dehalococcoidales bacterium]|nr:riboflavin synthase [Dehalococcoidales bacterium]